MKSFVIAGLAGAVAWGAAAAPALKDTPNLIVNGSFEEGPPLRDGVYQWVDKGSDAVKGWVVTRGQIDVVGEKHWPAADGKRSLDLHGSPGLGGVMQKFKTTKGKTYRVSFAVSANPDTKKETMTLGIKAAGQDKSFKIETAGKTQKDMGWTAKTWDFIAAGDETELEFYTLETTDPFGGPALDNVTVTAR